MMQMVEDTLMNQAHTKPLLPSQLIRYREVQVPDGRSSALSITPFTLLYLPVMPVPMVTLLKVSYPTVWPTSGPVLV